jgi:hypothetical protein
MNVLGTDLVILHDTFDWTDLKTVRQPPSELTHPYLKFTSDINI